MDRTRGRNPARQVARQSSMRRDSARRAKYALAEHQRLQSSIVWDADGFARLGAR